MGSCIIDDEGLCPSGSGSLTETVFEFNDFTGVEIRCAGDVMITQADTFSVIAETQANLTQRLDVSVDDRVLEIDMDGCVRDYDLRVFVQMPQVDFLKISGSGDIIGENAFNAENLRLRISGSGDMDLDVDYSEIDARVTGSGTVEIQGACNEFEYKITGSGDIHGFDLISNRGDVEITGSGDAEVFVNEFLSVKITGSGDVLYKGTPEEILTDISGSGDVRDVN